MVRWLVTAMAGNTIRRPSYCVIEGRWQPSTCTVAGGTLPGIMVSWAVWSMTGEAVRRPGNGMIEGRWPPGIGAVAGRTLTRIVIGWAVFQVAAVAILCDHTSMVENNLTPPCHCMAGRTIKAEQTVMRFILGMASDTGWIITLVSIILVAVETIQIIMSANQREPGSTMIENAKFPTFRCMANTALVPHLILVDIILLVAGFTCLRGVLECLHGRSPGMALSTVQEGMQIVQFEDESIVIKIGSVGFYSIMAIQTGIPEQGNVIGRKFRTHQFMASCTIRYLKAGEP